MNKQVSPKTFSRYVAIQALYNSIYQNDYETIKNYFLEGSEFKLQFDFKMNLRRYKFNKNFLKTLLVTFNEEKNKVDGLIESNLQKNWNLKRLPIVLLSILRVAVTEMIISKNTSIGIIASEYIMFTESFYTDNEYLFTNAILEKIYLNLQQKNTLNE
jgi:transcription antitermination factor NusB